VTSSKTPVPLVAPVASVTGIPGAGTRLSAPGTTSPAPVAALGEVAAAGAGSTRARKPRLTGLALIAARMPENGGSESLDYKLRKMLADNFTGRLIWQHNSDSRRAHTGWPDWMIARKYRTGGHGGVLVRELKRENTQPTEEQLEWLCALKAAGFDVGIWRPSSLLSGQIAKELAALAGLGGAA
jgi:hypothetical protein